MKQTSMGIARLSGKEKMDRRQRQTLHIQLGLFKYSNMTQKPAQPDLRTSLDIRNLSSETLSFLTDQKIFILLVLNLHARKNP
uniref:Uncharacterized protein n=1 Tax=Rhizophora mucronata TaxID=61149 RepID=A0A2P2Q8B3_RHIMU